jgi:subtilisin family serine protease
MKYTVSPYLLTLGFLILTSCAGNSDSPHDGTIAIINGQQQLIKDDATEKRVCASTYCEPNYTVFASFGRKHDAPSTPLPYTPPPVYTPPQPQPSNPVTQNPSVSPANYAAGILDAGTAWSRTPGSTNVIVAIVDTGMDLTHPELVNHLAVNVSEQSGRSGSDDDQNGYVDDVYGYDFFRNASAPSDEAGHGTHVAGIIAQIAPNVKLMPVKFMGPQGQGGTYDAIRAIDYAVSRGVNVINASWGSAAYSQLLEQSVTRAINAGVTFVAAAGNDGANFNLQPNFPASFANVISVAASDSSDRLASYSNYGTSVTIAAPGDNIYSTYPGGGHQYMSGTSMASPQVAGTVGLMKSVRADLSQSDVTSQLCRTADRILTNVTKCGRMNTGRAVSEL